MTKVFRICSFLDGEKEILSPYIVPPTDCMEGDSWYSWTSQKIMYMGGTLEVADTHAPKRSRKVYAFWKSIHLQASLHSHQKLKQQPSIFCMSSTFPVAHSYPHTGICPAKCQIFHYSTSVNHSARVTVCSMTLLYRMIVRKMVGYINPKYIENKH